MQAGIAACVPDRVPLSQRGAVSGWLGAPQCVGVVLAVFLVSKVAAGSTGYLVLAVLTVALTLPFVLAAQEQRLDPAQRSPFRLRAFLLLVYTVVVVITAVVSGVVSDRGGWRRAPVALSGGVMAIPAVMLALWPAWPVVLAGAAILGLGFGIYLSVDQALVTQVLPAASGHGRQRRSNSVW